MKSITFSLCAFLCVILSSISLAQQTAFQPYAPSEAEILNQPIKSTKANYFMADLNSLKMSLQAAPYREETTLSTFQIQLPKMEGGFNTYKVLRNKTMHPTLNALYPDILTFDGININNTAEKVKFDITPQGFHAMIYSPYHSTIFIDPIHSSSPNKLMAYFKKDFYSNKVNNCEFESAEEKFEKLITSSTDLPEYGTCQLRTYRLALAATAEYTAYHTNAALAAAAQVTTMNRVNGVYEKDIAITMTLVPNNNLLIYTNAGTDPYTNGNAGAMITQNVSNVNSVIGSSNYDIGHVFGTNSGGLAGLGVVCGSNKARGVTGSSNPIGDPFDIDYVAHEMGHQFNANHTQNNSCNTNGGTAVEPGSASTIMGYAGICAPNVQNNSDDHFHGISLSEMTNLITSGGHTCPVVTSLSNAAPVITGTNGNISVPANTPFALTCIATDIDADSLTYNWEQTNNQISTQPPVSTSTTGPNFRSLPSNPNPTRYFPNMVDLSNGGPYTWEVVPSVSRLMNFRCSVRDNAPGPGGCQDFVNVTVNTIATAGPFVVTYPNATGIIWAGASTQTVTWSVANTTAAPINASMVDIYLSTDGGLTYPTLLLAGTSNDGSQAVTVPNTATTTARIMVISAAGTFFDISDNDFEITTSTFDYTLTVAPSNLSICQGTNGVFNITTSAIGAYTTAINLTTIGLPAGASAVFVPSTVTPGQSSVLTISNAPAGSHTITVEGNSAGNIHSGNIVLDVQTNSIAAVNLLSPTTGATNTNNPTTFTWTAITGVTYDIDISTSPTFATIDDQATGLTNPTFTSIFLSSSTQYYWRVSATNGCASSVFSQSNYTTGSCFTVNSVNVPVAISSSGTPTVTSVINIPQTGFIGSIRIPKIQGEHTYMSDLTMNLISPLGVSIPLISGICGSQNDFDFGFDDAAAPGALPCPPTSGLYYQPTGSFASLAGTSIQGNWTLEIIDGANNDGGELQFWSMELCISNTPCLQPTTPVVSGPTSICAGETATLTLAGTLNDASQWEWYSASCGGTLLGTGTSLNVNPSTNTSYFVRGAGGCVTNATCANHTIGVTNLDMNVAQSGSQVSSLQTGASYQWLLCSDNYAIISGATNVSYTPSIIQGSYAVQVSLNGCVDTSACTSIDLTGLNELSQIGLILAPNPANNNTTLSWDKSASVERIEVLDGKGRVVFLEIGVQGEVYSLNVKSLESAMYIIRLTHSKGVENIRLLKTE